jgi:hypothetical protein
MLYSLLLHSPNRLQVYLNVVAQDVAIIMMEMFVKHVVILGANQNTSQVNNFVHKPLINNVLNIKNKN